MDESTQLKIIEYQKIFMKNGYYNAVYYCQRWNGTNNIYFREKEPEDFVLEILERILEGKRMCFLNDYEHFKGSLYFHLRYEMLTYFRCRKKKEPENIYFIENESSNIVSYDDEQFYEEYCDEIVNGLLSEIDFNDIKHKLFSIFDHNEEIEEITVLEGIIEGKTRKEIAEDTGLSLNEVTNIKKRIFRKIRRHIYQIITG